MKTKHLYARLFLSVLIALFSVLLFGCTISTKLTDKSEINETNEVKQSLTQTRDSSSCLFSEQQLLLFKSSDNKLVNIQFGKEGGSYNTQTGQAEGVESVEITEQTNDSVDVSINTSEETNTNEDSTFVSNDSISVVNNKMDVVSEKEIGVNWLVWFLVGMAVMFVAIVVLRKIPQTSWLLCWI